MSISCDLLGCIPSAYNWRPSPGQIQRQAKSILSETVENASVRLFDGQMDCCSRPWVVNDDTRSLKGSCVVVGSLCTSGVNVVVVGGMIVVINCAEMHFLDVQKHIFIKTWRSLLREVTDHD